MTFDVLQRHRDSVRIQGGKSHVGDDGTCTQIVATSTQHVEAQLDRSHRQGITAVGRIYRDHLALARDRQSGRIRKERRVPLQLLLRESERHVQKAV